MKSVFKFLFLGAVAVTLMFAGACAKKNDGGAAYPPGFYPPGTYPPGVYPNGFYPIAYQGTYQSTNVVNGNAFNQYLIGQFCVGKVKFLFGLIKWDTCGIVNGTPALELNLQTLDLQPSAYGPYGPNAKLVIYAQVDPHYYVQGPNSPFPTNLPKHEINLRMRFINYNNQGPNTGFEGIAIDPIAGNGFGARIAVRGVGKPGEGPLQIQVFYNDQLMLVSSLARVR